MWKRSEFEFEFIFTTFFEKKRFNLLIFQYFFTRYSHPFVLISEDFHSGSKINTSPCPTTRRLAAFRAFWLSGRTRGHNPHTHTPPRNEQKILDKTHPRIFGGLYYLFYDYAAIIEDYRHITLSHFGAAAQRTTKRS